MVFTRVEGYPAFTRHNHWVVQAVISPPPDESWPSLLITRPYADLMGVWIFVQDFKKSELYPAYQSCPLGCKPWLELLSRTEAIDLSDAALISLTSYRGGYSFE